ncbi:propionyl-CoA carboxylase [Heterostelium album PN500]|uniref:propionyl-CoA carboxylase n=1 Tax=Heterostelium pallidum (strain ATCC 26659 / Pp 5 / PN500) TaxID=670386 RepID=D3BRG0_HETP5|nr:propionyl-CoA carboxylase [Heterostelium album PN500]EFA75992.1 propionyl-CoA carboxylase [Heterostelium album PN500]|eukprot:XP_020428126.1 propionyl-CoA carboxylase [Heterostelium album PN500]
MNRLFSGSANGKKNLASSISMQFRSFHSTNPNFMFEKILIANRGEIACRVMQTCRKMGIKTVAIHSDADRYARHVREADEAVCVGPAPTSQSYLNIDAIVEAIKKTGAQAVHPGYGFLSENSHFVKELENIGVTFIGPGSYAMHALGDKIESKKIAKNAGVSVIPGFIGEVDTLEEVIKTANSIGYPVMVKASAGGGGKGMRIAWNDKDVEIGFRLSKQEAKSSFGDDRMLIEKYIDRGRHIEIQVLSDGETALYFPERECSIQRRNQKVIEEAPSPFLDDATRTAMGRQAAALCKAVGYKSAGTVEFLVDSQKNFYFLEMNTRLQVEHPITEEITGQDLVEHMIRIAYGEKLKLQQEDVKIKGWAMESRVYAEDPYQSKKYIRPEGQGVRIDGGIFEGGEISTYYDPLISKLITYGDTRKSAIIRMKKALDEYYIKGVNHNVPFLRDVMENEKFLSGDISTKFIPEEYPDGFKGYNFSPKQIEQLTICGVILRYMDQYKLLTNSSNQAKQNPLVPDEFFAVTVGNVKHLVRFEAGKDKYSIQFIDEKSETVTKSFEVGVEEESLEIIKVTIGGNVHRFQIHDRTTHAYLLQFHGTKIPVIVRTPDEEELVRYMPEKKTVDSSNALLSPMPGAILSVAVKVGDKVVLGQELCIIEAMKMQNVLRAPRDCEIKSIKVTPGTNVAVDEILIEFK